MIRGTTPTNTFTVDMDLRAADVIYITYKQGCTVVVERTKDQLDSITATELTLTLTQDETLKFNRAPVNTYPSYTDFVSIQIRARFSNGLAVASNIIKTTVGEILKDGVI
jgi:hypothetical protein